MTSSEPDNLLLNVLGALQEYDVDFVVCGGVACVLHGVNRVTQDVDIYVCLEQKNLARFVEAAKSLKLTPRMPEPLENLISDTARRKWVTEKGARVVTLNFADSPFQVDVFLDYPVAYNDLKANSVVINADDVQFRISSIEHLIAAKSAVEEPRRTDQRDIEDLQEILKHG